MRFVFSRVVVMVALAFTALTLAAGQVGCTGGQGGAVQTGGGGAATGDLNLQLYFGSLQPRQSARIDPSVTELEIQVKDMDANLLVPVQVVPVDPGQAVEPLQVTISGLPLQVPFLVRVVARDGQGNTVMDAEDSSTLGASAGPLQLGLLPVSEVLSGVALLQPMISLDPAVAQAMKDADNGQLEAEGLKFIEETVLLYPVSPAAGYRVAVGNQEVVVEEDGRFRIRSDSALTGTITHPTDPLQTMTFEVASLTPGQSPEALLVFQIPFRGGCGMTPDLPLACEGIVGGAPSPSPSPPPNRSFRDLVGALAEAISQNTVNLCNMIVPMPTEVSYAVRGSYPDPKQYSVSTQPILTGCHNECEQDNGIIDPGSGGVSSYLLSTCHRYVAFGCCPNENTMADVEQLVNYPIRYLVALNNNFVNFVSFGRRGRVVILSGPTFPGDKFACMDNHKGRECQQLLIGDITLDFTRSGRAGLITPRTPGTVVKVVPGEVVEFVLHNNGCFGTTDTTTTRREIAGSLTRTWKETTLTPGPQRGPVQGNELMLSSDPLLGSAPTAGKLTGFAVPAAANVTPTSTGFLGFGASTTTIPHFLSKPNVTPNQGNCTDWRYFCDVALSYTVPPTAQNGQRDTYVFTTDTCSVEVTFLVVDPSDLPPPPQPSPSPSPPPPGISLDASQIVFEHRVGESPCPQTVGTVSVTNSGSVAVDVQPALAGGSALTANVQGTGDTSIRLQPGQAAVFEVKFDCSRTESFTTNVGFTATSVIDSQTTSRTLPVTAILLHQAVLLDFPFGPFPAGTEIRLTRITGGHVAGPDACDDFHYHGEPISIDGQHVGFDPNPTGCGYGKIVWTEGGAAP